MLISEQLLSVFDSVIEDLSSSDNVNDANIVSILKDHLIHVAGRLPFKVSKFIESNIDVLLDGVNIIIKMPAINDHLEEFCNILSYSNVTYYLNEFKFFKVMYKYSLSAKSISDILFGKSLSVEDVWFVKEHQDAGKDVITTYERFIKILKFVTRYYPPHKFDTYNEKHSRLLESILRDHEDYFLRSIQEFPELMVGNISSIYHNIYDESIRQIISDNIPFSRDVLKNIEFNSYRNRGDDFVKFLGKVVHQSIFTLRTNYIPSHGALCNKYDDINFSISGSILRTALKYTITHIINLLIHEEHVIEQAKNYKPGYNLWRCEPHQSDVLLWKLNFMRMFTFEGNLLTISTRAR